METIAIIPAGGTGSRIGLNIPKQFYKIKGKELIAYTVEVFQKSREVDKIIIPAPKEYFKLLEVIKKKYRFSKITAIVEGGRERQDSVYNALMADKINADDLIAVHDAARPLLSKELLQKVLLAAKEKGNGVLAVKARDTLALGDKQIISYQDRDMMYYLQTPQVFKYSDLLDAFNCAKKENFTGTDESMLIQRTGRKVNIVESSYVNFKITTPEDLQMFKRFVSEDGKLSI